MGRASFTQGARSARSDLCRTASGTKADATLGQSPESEFKGRPESESSPGQGSCQPTNRSLKVWIVSAVGGVVTLGYDMGHDLWSQRLGGRRDVKIRQGGKSQRRCWRVSNKQNGSLQVHSEPSAWHAGNDSLVVGECVFFCES
jgi:hypothetical protein